MDGSHREREVLLYVQRSGGQEEGWALSVNVD